MSKIIQPYIQNLKNIKRQLPQIAQQAVKDNAEVIIEVVQNKQLRLGIGSDGSIIADNYAPSTEEVWRFVDPPIDPSYKVTSNKYDFYWSGDFFKGMHITVSEETYDILSSDGKSALLESLYGEMLDLTEENNKSINDTIISPAIEKFILDNLLNI